jgi:hypothetical protein
MGHAVAWFVEALCCKRVKFPMRPLDFSVDRTMALGSTQPLTEMSIGNLSVGKGRPAHKADNLTAICEPIIYRMWEPRRTTQWTSTASYRHRCLSMNNRDGIIFRTAFWPKCTEVTQKLITVQLV